MFKIKRFFISLLFSSIISNYCYASSGPTVFPNGIASSAPVVTPDGVTQGTIGDTVTKAQGSVQQATANQKNGYAKLDGNGNVTVPVTGSVFGDVSGANATPDGKTVSQIGQMAVGSVQKTSIGAANGVAPLDANKMMSAAVSGDSSSSPVLATSSTSPRKLSDRAADILNIKDFGAKMDGKTDDTPAFQQTKIGAAPLQTIHIPAGKMNIWGWPDTSSKVNFWELDGTTQGNSLIYTIGTDPVLTHTGGGSWFFSRATPLNADPLVRVDRYEHENGGTDGYVESAVQHNCILPSGEVDYYEWCNLTKLTINSHGSGQHVGDAVAVIRTDTSGSTAGEMWGEFRTVTDNTGLEGDKSGAVVASEMNTNVNGKAYYGGRGILAAQMSAGLLSGYAPEASFAIRTNAFNNGYFDSTLLLTGMYRDTAIDTTKAAPLSVNETLTSAAAVGATTLSVNTTHNGIFVGQYVTGSGISPGTTVLSITDTSVTLSKGLVTAMATNSALVFCSDSPVFSMNPGQFLQYGDRNHRVVFGGDINDDGSVDTSKGNTVAISTWSAPGSIKFYENTFSGHLLDMSITNSQATFSGTLVAKNLSMDNGSVTTDGAGNLTVKSLISASFSYDTLPTSATMGQSVFCSDCYSKLRDSSDTQTGVIAYWNGSRWNDALGNAILH